METNLVKFIATSVGRTITDINLHKLIRNYRNIPIKIEIPIFQFANKNCLYELGGYNTTRGEGSCMFVLDENFNICDGINFFKGRRRKANGKQAIVPVTNRNYVIFGNMFRNKNNIDIRCNIYIYVISEFCSNTKKLENDTDFEYKTCKCELVYSYSSSIFTMENITPKFKETIKLALEKLLKKNCKKVICTNGWFNGRFNQNELLLINNFDEIINHKTKTINQIINTKDEVEDYFISSDIPNSRVMFFVFDTSSPDSITVRCHLLDDFDIKTIKQQKERIAPKIAQSFNVTISNDYEFNIRDAKFFMCNEDRSVKNLRDKIIEGRSPFYTYHDDKIFAIRLFKG